MCNNSVFWRSPSHWVTLWPASFAHGSPGVCGETKHLQNLRATASRILACGNIDDTSVSPRRDRLMSTERGWDEKGWQHLPRKHLWLTCECHSPEISAASSLHRNCSSNDRNMQNHFCTNQDWHVWTQQWLTPITTVSLPLRDFTPRWKTTLNGA